MLASSVALGTLAGLLTGGHWRRLRGIRIAWWPLAVVALALRVAGVILPLDVVVYVVAILLVAVVALRNARVPGAALIGVGSLMNAAVIALNGGMPVDPAAAAAVDASPLLNDRLHVVLDETTRISWLADVIAIGLFRNVYSIGDVVIAVGGFWVPFAALRRR
jgi:hypothetical protein